MFNVAALSFVLLSGMVHAVWNLFAKKSRDKVVFLWLAQWIAIVLFAPWAWEEFAEFHPTAVGMGLLLLSMLLHGVYVLLLSQAYKLGDLSQAYPIMRGTSPVVVPLIAVIWLGERLSGWGWLWIAFIFAGIMWVSGGRRLFSGSFRENRMLWTALSVGISISCYIAADAVAVKFVPPMVLNEASNIGNMLALSRLALTSGAITTEWKLNRWTILLGGVLAPGGYILFLHALMLAPAAQLAPMREIGTVFGTLLGLYFLHEPQGRSRLIGSMLITAGVIGLGFSG